MFKYLTVALFLLVILLQVPDTIAQKLDSTWVLAKNKNDIELEGRGAFIAEKKDIIRIQNINAYWYFTPELSGMVRVSFQMLVDPGGNIPVWLINKFIIEGPYQNLYRLRELMEKNSK